MLQRRLTIPKRYSDCQETALSFQYLVGRIQSFSDFSQLQRFPDYISLRMCRNFAVHHRPHQNDLGNKEATARKNNPTDPLKIPKPTGQIIQ